MHPREIFKQKERAMSTTSVSSPQPGETSLWAWPRDSSRVRGILGSYVDSLRLVTCIGDRDE